MSKGSAQAAQQTLGQDKALTGQYNNAAIGLSSSLTPFLQDELLNPQGYGQSELSQLQTQGGQVASGATGAGREAATLAASRGGNTAAIPGIIDANTRAALQQQSNNMLQTNEANVQLQNQQRQAAASGLGQLYGEDVGAALKALGLEDTSIQDWTQGKSAANATDLGWANFGADVLMGKPPGQGNS